MPNCQINIAIALLTFGLCCAGAEDKTTIPSGSAIYVDPNSGFDQLLSSAFQANHVALRVVSVPEQADYVLDSAVFPVAAEVRRRSTGRSKKSSAEAVKLTSKTGEVVWRYTVTQHTLDKGSKAVAEECATHIKGIVAKAPKP